MHQNWLVLTDWVILMAMWFSEKSFTVPESLHSSLVSPILRRPGKFSSWIGDASNRKSVLSQTRRSAANSGHFELVSLFSEASSRNAVSSAAWRSVNILHWYQEFEATKKNQWSRVRLQIHIISRLTDWKRRAGDIAIPGIWQMRVDANLHLKLMVDFKSAKQQKVYHLWDTLTHENRKWRENIWNVHATSSQPTVTVIMIEYQYKKSDSNTNQYTPIHASRGLTVRMSGYVMLASGPVNSQNSCASSVHRSIEDCFL